jgi:hypothetical protein
MIESYRKSRFNKKNRDEISNWIIERCSFLTQKEYIITCNSSKDLDNYIEYTNQKLKRKLRFHTKQNRKCDIELVDSGFFPLKLNPLYYEIDLPNPSIKKDNKSPKFLISSFLDNFEEIQNFESSKNSKYYSYKLDHILKTSEYSNEFGYPELYYINHLVKEYAENTIQKRNATYAEYGLILLATVKPFEIRDFLTSAILINSSLKEIGKDPVRFFKKYKSMNYNVNIELFDRMIKDSDILTEADGCFTLELGKEVEYKSKYYQKMNSYNEWYTHNKRSYVKP